MSRVLNILARIQEDLGDHLFSKIEKEVNKPSFVRDWISSTENSLDGVEFYDRLDISAEAPSKKEIAAGARKWLESQLDDLEAGFDKHLDLEGSKFIVHRCIAVDDVNEFVDNLKKGKYSKGFKGVGTWWSWSEEAAECHWGRGKQNLYLEGLVPMTSINVLQTAWANMSMQLGADEKEITLKEGASVSVRKVMKDKENLLSPGEVLNLKA